MYICWERMKREQKKKTYTRTHRANIFKRLAFEWNWKVKCELRLNLHKVSPETLCNIQIFSYTRFVAENLFSLSLSCVHSTTLFTMWNGAEWVLCDAQTILIIFPIVFCNVVFSPSKLSFIQQRWSCALLFSPWYFFSLVFHKYT